METENGIFCIWVSTKLCIELQWHLMVESGFSILKKLAWTLVLGKPSVFPLYETQPKSNNRITVKFYDILKWQVYLVNTSSMVGHVACSIRTYSCWMRAKFAFTVVLINLFFLLLLWVTAHAKSILGGCVLCGYKLKFFATTERTVHWHSLHACFVALCKAAGQTGSLKWSGLNMPTFFCSGEESRNILLWL